MADPALDKKAAGNRVAWLIKVYRVQAELTPPAFGCGIRVVGRGHEDGSGTRRKLEKW